MIRCEGLITDLFSCSHIFLPHAGSGVVRIHPLHFLARCRKKRLNQALSVLSLSRGFREFLLFIRATFGVVLVCICMCYVFVVLVKLSVLAKWLARKTSSVSLSILMTIFQVNLA